MACSGLKQRVVAPARHCRKSDGEPRGKEQVGYALSLCACSAMPRTDVCYTIPATGARTAQVTSILFLTPTKTKRVSNILTLAKAPRPPTERSRTDGLRRACQVRTLRLHSILLSSVGLMRRGRL